jgi:hypothetical protein
METNPYEYDNYNKPVAWIPQQNQPYPPSTYEGRYNRTHTGQQQFAQAQNQKLQPAAKVQKPKAPERMSKARALNLVRGFKKGLVVASILSFASFSGLAAYHQSTTTSSNTSSSSQTTSASGSTSKNSTSSSTSSSSNSSNSSSSSGYFNQNGSSNFGSSSSSSSGSSVSGTSVS